MKNMQSILNLLILLLALAVSTNGESDPFLQDDPFLNVDKDGLVQWKHRFGKDLIDDISRSGAVNLTTENTPEAIRHLVPKGHEVYDLKPFFSKQVHPHVFQGREYIIYDLTTGHLLASTIPEVTTYLVEYTRHRRQTTPNVISTQVIFTSVKRPKDPFMVWTQAEIDRHDPKLIASASLTSRSGERSHTDLRTKDKTSGQVELEATLGEEHRYLDYRLVVTLQTDNKDLSIDFNTGITLFNGEPLIQPFGISTDPERIIIMSILAKTITPEGLPTRPVKEHETE